MTVMVDAHYYCDKDDNDNIDYSCDPGLHNGDIDCRKDTDCGDSGDKDDSGDDGNDDNIALLVMMMTVETDDKGDKGDADHGHDGEAHGQDDDCTEDGHAEDTVNEGDKNDCGDGSITILVMRVMVKTVLVEGTK